MPRRRLARCRRRRRAGAGRGAPAAQAPASASARPAFELVDTQGKTVKLSDFKGRHVVLEWTNPGCPFVVKHYGSQNMQGLQKEAAAEERGLAEHQLHRAGPCRLPGAGRAGRPQYKDWGAAPTAMLMDDSGKVGRAYGARTTPHMYVIDPAGMLVYAGGIDDKRSGQPGRHEDGEELRARRAGRIAGRQAGQHAHRHALRLQRQVRGRLVRTRLAA